MKNLVKLFAVLVFGLFAGAGMGFSAEKCVQTQNVTYVRAGHILVDTKEQADMIKSKIDNGASFESMAKQCSKCPSGQNGGDLGYFGKGDMVKEFENAAFNLPVGQVSEPVKTQFGWHLIKVYNKR